MNKNEPSPNPLLAPFAAIASSLQAGATVAAGGRGVFWGEEPAGERQGNDGPGTHELEQGQQRREATGNGGTRLAGNAKWHNFSKPRL